MNIAMDKNKLNIIPKNTYISLKLSVYYRFNIFYWNLITANY